MQQQQLQQLIDKYLAGHATADEKRLLANIFESMQSDRLNILSPDNKQLLEDKMLHRLLQSVHAQAAKPMPAPFKWKKLAIAAVLLLLMGFTAVYYVKSVNPALHSAHVSKPLWHDVEPGRNRAVLTLDNGSRLVLNTMKNGMVSKNGGISIKKTRDGQLVYAATADKNNARLPAYNTISTPRGGQYQVILPDGTRVWLNAASSLRFPTAFTGRQREVELTGEAYFEVTKNIAHPFIVRVNDLQIKVLGTHFNVMAYTDEPAAKTTLLQGVVQLNKGTSSTELKPGEQGVIKGNTIQVNNVDANEAVAWKNGFFEFKRAGLRDIMKQLSRWYDVEVIYEGNVPDDEFVGRINRDVKLSEALHILELNHVHFKIEGKTITITP